MWPENKPLPSPNEIRERLISTRKTIGFTQHALAAAARISQSQLANVEKGRRELYFRIGWKICKALNVNQWHLATGQGPIHPFHNFDPDEAAGRIIEESAFFGAVCCRRLAEELRCRNELLTNVSDCAKQSDVKALLPKLLEQLKKATAERGKKTALAKFLGVPLVSVSQWLSGVREPGGETTLKMKYWVEHPEIQK